ncbi:hypothetical protein F4820DRAFT_443581 [Hypoxylon rubiginosum]|uniref:Uncharacterized protein n=1 Tax=Hypoxylon rubiginosum TaxID=110542 RepID=A0ACB9ZFI1_9PEZI|nr:hypothetical protein F4820DRAFT_443581 [Hypoxylon rubiginosum]
MSQDNVSNPGTPATEAALIAASVHFGKDGTEGNGAPTHSIADNNMSAMMSQFGGLGLNGHGAMPGMIPMATADGRIVHVPANYPAPGVPYGFAPEAYTAAYSAPYLAYPGYNHFMQPSALGPYTPARVNSTQDRTEASSQSVPDLNIRRSSYSTNESTPATPFFGSMMGRDPGARVAIFDRSSYNTPSPQQILTPKEEEEANRRQANQLMELRRLADLDPKIPSAIPAIFTDPKNMKTLEQSLENKMPGNRNVYIRGLHPTTDDALLLKYAERFGKVETSKAIIDAPTGACKGFGFSKFYDVRDSERCIRGFFTRGYEVGFARESFNARLRRAGDESSTNLYLSNLPKEYGEMEIGAVFEGYAIMSSKILRDNLGQSRGVGFARFENRDICDHIIKEFSGKRLGDDHMPLQIRYSDTETQKEMKRQTAKRRQYRTNEYNASAYGTPLVGMVPHNNQMFRPSGGSYGAQQGASRIPRPVPRSHQNGSGGYGGQGTRPASLGQGCGNDGVEIRVESPLVAHGSSQSSPVKETKA